jgi:FkbM family methyltransferase
MVACSWRGDDLADSMTVSFDLRAFAKRVIPKELHPLMFSLRRQWRRSRNRQDVLGRHATAVLTETGHGKLLVPAGDVEIGLRLSQDGDYGLDAIDLHLSLLTSKSRLLVVGTHVGALLIPLTRRVASAIGIEANPETFRLLEMNLLLNGVRNTFVHNIAAGDCNREVEFLMRACNTGCSAVLTDGQSLSEPWMNFDNPAKVVVQQQRLDDVVVERKFDLIIMDIEGAEAAALRGMPQILRESKRLQIEWIPYLVRQLPVVERQLCVETLTSNFPRAWVLEDRMRGVAPRQTDDLLHELLRYGKIGRDLWLEKP